MRWTMNIEPADTSLCTPVVTINSPFSENGFALNDFTEKGLHNSGARTASCVSTTVSRCRKKRKVEPSSVFYPPNSAEVPENVFMAPGTKFSKGQEMNELSSTFEDSKNVGETTFTRADDKNINLKKRNLEEREQRVLQIQRAMIADEDGDRPIHIAAAQEEVGMVLKLCSVMRNAGASVDLTNYFRQTALHVAAIVGNAQVVNVLLSNGASVQLQDRNGNTAVQLAVKYFREDVFRAFLSYPQTRAVLDSMDYEGFTALHHAIFRGNSVAVNCLYGAGAYIDAVDGKSGRTGLAHAVLAGQKEMINLLLQCNACVEKADYSGQTVLELALQTGNRGIIKLLEKEASTMYHKSSESSSSDTISHGSNVKVGPYDKSLTKHNAKTRATSSKVSPASKRMENRATKLPTRGSSPTIKTNNL